MAQKTDPSDIDPKEMERAQMMWDNFMEASKWSIIGIIIVLALLGIIFV